MIDIPGIPFINRQDESPISHFSMGYRLDISHFYWKHRNLRQASNQFPRIRCDFVHVRVFKQTMW